MQPTSGLRSWWSPARSVGWAATRRLNFSSWRWQETQKRLSRSLAASPARKRRARREAPTKHANPNAKRRASGRMVVAPPSSRCASAHGDRHRSGEHDARGRAGRAASGKHYPGWRGHRTDGGRPLRAVVERRRHRVRPWLGRRLDRPHNLAFGQLLRGKIRLLVVNDRAVQVLFEPGGAPVHPLRLFLAVAARDLRGTDDDPAVALNGSRLEPQVRVNEEHPHDALSTLHVHRDLRLLTGLQARRSID